MAFGRWATAFYSPIVEPTDDVDILAARKQMHEVSSEDRFIPTVDRLSLEELASLADIGVLGRSALCMRNTELQVWAHNADKALFNCDPESAFSHVDTIVLWCDMGVTSSTFTAGYLAQRFTEGSEEGKRTRKATIARIDEANHMVIVAITF